MGRRSKKNPYDMLDTETMAAIDGGDENSINARIADVAKNQAALEEAIKSDDDLKEKRNAVKGAMFGYNDAKKRNKQVVKYCRLVLSSKGKDSGSSGFEKDETPEPDQTSAEAAERQAQVDAKNGQTAQA